MEEEAEEDEVEDEMEPEEAELEAPGAHFEVLLRAIGVPRVPT